MSEMTGTAARWANVAEVALLLLFGAAVFLVHSALGSGAALALLAATTILLAATTFVTRRRMRRAEERARLVERALDAVPHAIFVVDPRAARNRYVNAAYTTLTGYAACEALDGDFDALGILGDRTHIPAFEALAEPPASARVIVLRRDGSTLPAKLDLCAVGLGDEGRYVVGILEHVGPGERAADRPPGARPHAQSPTPATSGRATEAFLSWLSHELRSPLNACVMWLDVLALAPQPDKVAKAVDAIKRNLARQARLVNDLNDAAKVAGGGIEVRTEPLDLAALLERNIDAWQSLAAGRQLAFRHRIDVDEAKIHGDPERLTQALNHLLESSINSTPPGGGVELRAHGGDGSWIVEIADTGAALSADDAANLGAPFWREPGSAKTRGGLGLGLAVAHHVAVRHGGSLTATGGASGARFALTLPAANDTKCNAPTAGGQAQP